MLQSLATYPEKNRQGGKSDLVDTGNGSAWTTAGGDYTSTVIDTDDDDCNSLADELHSWTLIGAGATNPINPTLGSDVNLLVKNDNTSGKVCYYYDDRGADPAFYPYFEITYTTTSAVTNNIVYSSGGV